MDLNKVLWALTAVSFAPHMPCLWQYASLSWITIISPFPRTITSSLWHPLPLGEPQFHCLRHKNRSPHTPPPPLPTPLPPSPKKKEEKSKKEKESFFSTRHCEGSAEPWSRSAKRRLTSAQWNFDGATRWHNLFHSHHPAAWIRCWHSNFMHTWVFGCGSFQCPGTPPPLHPTAFCLSAPPAARCTWPLTPWHSHLVYPGLAVTH